MLECFSVLLSYNTDVILLSSWAVHWICCETAVSLDIFSRILKLDLSYFYLLLILPFYKEITLLSLQSLYSVSIGNKIIDIFQKTEVSSPT